LRLPFFFHRIFFTLSLFSTSIRSEGSFGNDKNHYLLQKSKCPQCHHRKIPDIFWYDDSQRLYHYQTKAGSTPTGGLNYRDREQKNSN
jgi:hypothetical protein